jgi:signal transduction histidine kinase
MSLAKNRRVLLVDDNAKIHEDFVKILGGSEQPSEELSDAMAAFFDDADQGGGGESSEPPYELDSALQGDEGVERVRAALAEGRPYALTFVDVRMPPGQDGVKTIEAMWELDGDLQVVICTAFADYSREDIVQTLGRNDNLLILKKPFDPVEISQLAAALTEKWNTMRQLREQMAALEVARRAAEAATKAKSDFLANMSHEIRTPMIAILGYGKLLGDPSLEQDQLEEYVETIRSSGHHLLAVIDDILDLSRIESGRLALTSEPCGPTALVHEVGKLVSEHLNQKGLTFEVDCVGDVPHWVATDSVRLRQILLNLVGNAIKFTERGGVHMSVAAQAASDGGWRLSFAVRDTGIGMSDEQQARLFQPFSQGDSSMTRRYGGNGLGLYLSRNLARMLGGDIAVESELGQGSTFTLTIAAARSEAPSPAQAASARPAALPQQPGAPLPATTAPGATAALLRGSDEKPLSGLRVLLAEDVPMTQRLYSVYLKKAGAAVAVVDDGEKARDQGLAAQRDGQPFDVVLMDMQMPVLDGYEAVGQLRSAGYEGPIVALTAHAMSGDRERCLAAGCDDYATKPIEYEALVDVCRRAHASRSSDVR